jgi:tRNA pseudouridine13 synthase
MNLEELAYAGIKPVISADYKCMPADFQVTEELSFTPEGKGEYLYLFIEKSGMSTQEVQQELCRFFQRPEVDVSFSGMKDKQAITRQWFSVRLPGSKYQSLEKLDSSAIKVLQASPNPRKLKRGSHRCNHFSIVLRKLSHDPAELQHSLEKIQAQGVPNYFGEQRFGWQGSSLEGAMQLFAKKPRKLSRYRRGLYISAARAFLFNQVLSARVTRQNWDHLLAGDVMQLNGTSVTFISDAEDDKLIQRLATLDIHPTGPLWGSGNLQSQADCAALEQEIVQKFPVLKNGLEDIGANMQRRALRSPVLNLSYRVLEKDVLQLEFTLNRGAYATAMLRELVNLPHQDEMRDLHAAGEKTVIEFH